MTSADDVAETVVVRRLLPVPRAHVFAAWLDPASMTQWMRPAGVTGTTVEIDPRVGGRFRIVMRHGRAEYEHWGEYLVIEPPSLLSFTWMSESTDHRPTVVTVELHEKGAGTELILTHRRLPPTKVDEHQKGWADIVRLLDEMLAAVGRTNGPAQRNVVMRTPPPD